MSAEEAPGGGIDDNVPNKWCPVPGLPSFMYLPVPNGTVDPAHLERHVSHWLETGDWDEQKQVGFWLYTAYGRALPEDFRFLADRIMNLALAFPDRYEDELRVTLRGILANVGAGFDWEPYFARELGEQSLG